MENSESFISGEMGKRLLQTLVPINALTEDHLNTLMRDQSIEGVWAGQKILSSGEKDHSHLYLLSGIVQLIDAEGREWQLSADDEVCRFPLVHYQPRRHTIKALSDCSIMRFDSELLNAMLAWDQVARYITLDVSSRRDLDEDADWMLTLLKSNLFYKVPPININLVLDKFEAVYYSSGETVLRQGELGDYCYFIKEGVAGVYQSANDRSAPVLVAELSAGRCFGEDALVGDTPRNATIIMHSNGVLMRLHKQDFYLLLKQPQVKEVSLAELGENDFAELNWIDVRTQDEFEHGHMASAKHIPLDLLKLKARILNRDQPYIVYCNSGHRSRAACHFLTVEGYEVAMLQGGIESQSVARQKAFEGFELESL